MSLLFPLALLGALAVAAPIWLHLRRRIDPRILPFSTLRFLEDNPVPARQPMRLRDILLFAVRTIAILALAAAFAWPYIQKSNPQVIRESRVYILDNTFSHQANERFAKARDRLAGDVAGLSADVQVAVVELTTQPRVIGNFGDDRLTVQQRLKELQPSHQRGSYLAAFRQANMLLANSFGDKRRIMFLTDNQENQWTENLNTAPFLQGVEVTISPPSSAKAPNLSLSEPKLQRIFLGDKSVVVFTAKLAHDGSAARAEVQLRAGGEALLSRALELQNKPEVITLQTQWEADPNRWVSGELTAQWTGDALPADNHLYFVLPPVREGSIAVLAQSRYLRVALSPEVMRGHWASRVIDPAQIAQQLASNNDAEVLFIESSYLQSPDARKLVWRYLTNGRGVILLVNRLTPAVTGALRELGIEADSPAESGHGGNLVYVSSHHPIFHPFRSPDYGNLSEVKVHRHARLKIAEGVPLAFGEAGDVLLFQGTRFPGKLLVSTFGFDREQTSWPLHLSFIPFLDLALQHCRPAGEDPDMFEAAESTTITLPAGATANEVSINASRFAVTGNKAQVKMPDKPGIYEVTFDTPGPTRMVAVNPPPRESQLTYLAKPEALSVWTLQNSSEKPRGVLGAAAFALSRSEILRQQWWWWLILGVVFTLTIEILWASGRKAPA
jgi:hypothetical protein